MNRAILVAAGAVGGLLALWVGWGVYTARTAEDVPYETVGTVRGVEIRRYPQAVLVETTAPDERTAFRRLFRYIDGENDADSDVAMTAPVRTSDGGGRTGRHGGTEATGADEGTGIDMTAPVRTRERDGETTMAFYLPPEYEPGTAPVPTDSAVRLVVEPSRTLAVYGFSWFATDGRIERAGRQLLDALAAAGIEPDGEASLLRYDDPRTPPFVRTNEVAVEVPDGAVEG